MSNKESNPIRNGTIATVIGGILLSYWEPFRTFITKGLLWAWSLLNSAWQWLTSTHEIYGWIELLLTALSIPALIKLAFLITRKNEPSIYELYKSDRLFGVDWQWHYFNGSIQNLWCLCPSCKNELVYREFEPNRYNYKHDGLEPKTDFICERCRATICSLKGNKQYALSSVEREIRRKIRNNEWSNRQNS